MRNRARRLVVDDSAMTPGERSFRLGWVTALERNDGGRPEVKADYVARQGRSLRVVDVRDERSLLGPLGHVPGSDWVPLADAGMLHTRLGRCEPVVLVCEDGVRSLTLAAWLEEAGLDMVAAMHGGMRAWRETGLAVARDPGLRARANVLAALPHWAASGSDKAFTLEEIVEHVGNPRSVRWLKLAAFLLNGRLSCVDGRDHLAVVGSPGGDAGELILGLGALERLTGAPLSDQAVTTLVQRRVDAFGRFAFHTDTNAEDRLIAALRADPLLGPFVSHLVEPEAFRQFFTEPPEGLRAPLAELMARPAHVGCGHLRLCIEQAQRWGLRHGLAQQVLRGATSLRWEGAQELEVTPLPGGHSEGAVLNVYRVGDLDAFSQVPLVAPSIGGRQMFVNHPRVAAFLRRQQAHWLSQQVDLFSPPTAAALFEAMQALYQQQLAATLGALAPGLPVFDVTVSPEGGAEVKYTGTVP